MDENNELEYNENEIKNFLEQIESTSGQVLELEVFEKIQNFIKERFEHIPPKISLWEQMAFAFSEIHSEGYPEWNTYFRPLLSCPTKEGKIYEYPSIQKITPEIISYWEKRCKESNHPVFKARYSNLVRDFSENIKEEKPHYSIAQIFIDSVIEIAEKDLQDSVYVIRKLERALSLALSINDKERINKLIDAIINYEEKVAEDNKPSLWGFSYKLLVKNKKVQINEDKEQKIIKDLEERFERLLKGSDHWSAKSAALLLADYYFRNKKSTKAKNILLKLGTMIQQQADKASPLVASAWLEELYHLYLKYGLKNEADKISIKIKEMGEKSKSELKRIEVTMEIPKEEIEKFINSLIEGDLKTALRKIALYYIPRKDEVIQQLKNHSQKAPLFFLVTHEILDKEGRPIATIGPLEEDIDGHIVIQISQNMRINSFLLHETLKALINKFNLDTESIIDYLYESPIFDEKRRDFFSQSIKAYLHNDYLVALHILIPQIEALIRNLAEKIGLSVLKYSRSGAFNYRTLDDLLREKEIINTFTEDMCLYFRILFTDQRGWNLRNNICHGISQIMDFEQINADRVFHALLCLSLVKEKEHNLDELLSQTY